jgi:hypothetical protein
MWLDLPMEKTHPANDNLGLLQRHPRLLTKAHERDCNRERSPESDREKDSEEDTGRELALINFRIEALNWIEFYLSKKRTTANDSQVGWPGRSGASKRI